MEIRQQNNPGGNKPQNGRPVNLPPPPDKGTKTKTEPQLLDADCVEFLNLLRKPAVVFDVEAGYILGFTSEGIGKLVAAKHLPALAHLSDGDQKRFSTAQLLELAQDESWMSEATDIIYGSRRQSSADKP